MKNLRCILTAFSLLALFPVVVHAQAAYTLEEVSTHSTADDCYMVFDGQVYDVTDYLDDHDRKFLDIDSWCGQDMTDDFMTKAGEGRDHTGGYDVLARYLIGDVVEVPLVEEPVVPVDQPQVIDLPENPTNTNTDTPVETVVQQFDNTLLIIGGITAIIMAAAAVGYVVYKRKEH